MAETLTYICPSCGAAVLVGSSCTGCKPKKLRRSWEQDDTSDGLSLQDEDFDYDEFIAREFGSKPHKQLGVKWYWWLLGVGLIVLITLGSLMGIGPW